MGYVIEQEYMCIYSNILIKCIVCLTGEFEDPVSEDEALEDIPLGEEDIKDEFGEWILRVSHNILYYLMHASFYNCLYIV